MSMTPDPTTRDPAAILPCPFCTNDVSDDEGAFPTGGYWTVRCGNPNCNAEVSDWMKSGAIARWNRRDDAPALLAEVEALRLRAAELERQRDDYLSREWQATKAKAEAERATQEAVALLREARDTMANVPSWEPVSSRAAAFLAHHGARTGETK